MKFVKVIPVWVSIVVSLPLYATNDIAHFYAEQVSESTKHQLIQRVKESAIQPAQGHPRLYGTNDVWYQTITAYEGLDPDCTWQGSSGWGTIKNIKSEWDKFSIGGETCKTGRQGVPDSIEEHAGANAYLTDSITKWNRDHALRTVHLIRRMNYCHQINPESDCVYSKDEIERLSQAFLSYELERLRTAQRNAAGYIAAWHKGFTGNFFDLGSLPAFKLWTLILDTFWHSPLLLAEDRALIEYELEQEIDSYIEIYHLPEGSSGSLGRWAIHNGNNWTPILNAAATFWAITFWHEPKYRDKTREVLDIILTSNWLHRDEILQDGAYTEGPGYLGVSLDGSMEMNNLLLAAFGEPNHAVKWGVMGEKTTQWMIDNIATDGKFIDFGDVWARTGYADLTVVDLLYWRELVGLDAPGTQVADPCILEDFFATSYYLHAFYDTWSAPAHYARDFYSLTKQCHNAQSDTEVSLFDTYQLATIKQRVPSATNTAQQVTNDNIRNTLADQTFIAGNAVSNTFSHRELDFGAVIWTAFGNRLLSDWGYGQQSKPYEYLSVRGSSGHYVANDDQYLSFSIKHISGSANLSQLKIALKVRGVSRDLSLNHYLNQLTGDWQTVSIPLADFNVPDWAGLGNGLEYIRLRTTGFVKDGEFGLDELQITDVNGEVQIVWFGDEHQESLAGSQDGVTPSLSHPDRLHVTAIETSGGAHNTDSWARIYDSGEYANMSVFYLDSAQDLIVANYMDKLAIGANTLVLPNARDNSALKPENTHNSQFQGQTGQIHSLDVQGRTSIHMNGSLVYGKRLTEGNLEYFHRYIIPIDEGNYAIVDSFKTKPGKEDFVQEFWYSHKNTDKSCAHRAQDVRQHVDSSGALILTPRCNELLRNESVESFGRILGASIQGGQFKLGAPAFLTDNPLFNGFVDENGLSMINRLNRKEQRNLARFVPHTAVSEDVRVFLLQSSPSSSFTQASIEQTQCAESHCFSVSTGSGAQLDLILSKVEGQFVLPNTNITLPEEEGVDDPDNSDQPPLASGGSILTPVAFRASHPQRVGAPERLFDEQAALTTIPEGGSRKPEMRASAPSVSLSVSTTLPMKQAIATDSIYGRSIYVDELGQPLSAFFTFELEALSTISSIRYFDMSSNQRPGEFVVWVSPDKQEWTQVYTGVTGHYRQWAAIDMGNVQAKYIRFEMPEENTAKGITEMVIVGEATLLGQEQRITPTSVTSLHPARLKDFSPLFDEQSQLVEKPIAGQRLPELNRSKPNVNFSHTNDLPKVLPIETDSVYGRKLYVDASGQPMAGSIVIALDKVYQLSDMYYFDMSSRLRPGEMTLHASVDGVTWLAFEAFETSDYRNWVQVPVNDVDAKWIRIDFHEQNAAVAMTELVLYGKPYQ